jgi:hypothetical protein
MKLNQKTFNQKTKGLKAIAVMAIAVVGSFLTAGSAKAIPYIFTSGGLGARADFTAAGGILTLTLTNTGTADANNPAQVLTGVFFDIAGNPTLTPATAQLAGGSTVVYDPDLPNPFDGNVGGEWAYANFLASTNPFNATQGVSSAGLGLFGQANFNGPDLAAPTAVNGVNYGILPAAWVPAGDNTGLTQSGGLIFNSVTFTLGGFTGPLTNTTISNVGFQYGTAFSETPHPPGVPDGGMTVLLLGGALASLGMMRRFCLLKH